VPDSSEDEGSKGNIMQLRRQESGTVGRGNGGEKEGSTEVGDRKDEVT